MRIVHRDVTPHNPFITVDGRAIRLRNRQGDEPPQRDEGRGVKGKFPYMSPEQCMQPLTGGPTSLLGVILYRSPRAAASTGRAPASSR